MNSSKRPQKFRYTTRRGTGGRDCTEYDHDAATVVWCLASRRFSASVDPAQLDLPAGLTGSTGDLATTPSGREVSDPDARHDKLASAGGGPAAPRLGCPPPGPPFSTHPPAPQWIGTVGPERRGVRSEKGR